MKEAPWKMLNRNGVRTSGSRRQHEVRSVLQAYPSLSAVTPFSARCHPAPMRFFERRLPNELRHTDVIYFIMPNHEKVFVIGYLDDYSCYPEAFHPGRTAERFDLFRYEHWTALEKSVICFFYWKTEPFILVHDMYWLHHITNLTSHLSCRQWQPLRDMMNKNQIVVQRAASLYYQYKKNCFKSSNITAIFFPNDQVAKPLFLLRPLR